MAILKNVDVILNKCLRSFVRPLYLFKGIVYSIEVYSYFLKASVTLWPPNPKELESATLTVCSLLS